MSFAWNALMDPYADGAASSAMNTNIYEKGAF